MLGPGDPLGGEGLVKVGELGVESGASALATLLGRGFGRKRGGNRCYEEAKEARAHHYLTKALSASSHAFGGRRTPSGG